jgi:hypothetical protein
VELPNACCFIDAVAAFVVLEDRLSFLLRLISRPSLLFWRRPAHFGDSLANRRARKVQSASPRTSQGDIGFPAVSSGARSNHSDPFGLGNADLDISQAAGLLVSSLSHSSLNCAPLNPRPPQPSAMADQFQARTLKRKNVKGLALNAAPKATSNPPDGDAQVPGAVGNSESNRTDTLEIGLEFRLDLRSEDLVTLKELGAGNGGTVSKVMHASTKVVMARKVCVSSSICRPALISSFPRRLSVWRPKRTCGNKFYENFESDTTAIVLISSHSMVHSKMKPEILCCAWNTWTSGRWTDVGNNEYIADRQPEPSTAFPKTSDLFASMYWARSQSPSWPVLSTSTKYIA